MVDRMAEGQIRVAWCGPSAIVGMVHKPVVEMCKINDLLHKVLLTEARGVIGCDQALALLDVTSKGRCLFFLSSCHMPGLSIISEVSTVCSTMVLSFRETHHPRSHRQVGYLPLHQARYQRF